VAWNFLGWERTENTAKGVMTLPAMGWSDAAMPGEGVSVSEKVLENKFFRLELDGEGRMVSLLHKATGRETLKAPSNTMHLFEDPAKDRLSAWDSYMEYTNKETVIPCESVQVVENTPQRGAVRLTWRFGKSVLTQDITIYSDTQRPANHLILIERKSALATQ
jgi:alpha-mannosidase